MAVVGISFGSATSGTGFDVSATVASIVSNLRQVENPWNTKITELKADDTALTSIGTDLSALSTSLTTLTNFQGVMAEKQGSSSNSDVLTLTTAAATASAGTHSIVVSQLAQTASDYSDYIAATDTLSGALTIQVGTGTATTIPVVSGTSDTLKTYAAAINAADIGVTASVISDASGSSLSIVSKTSGSTGGLTITQGGTVAGTATSTTAATSVAPTDTDAATNTFTLGASTDKLSGTFSYAVGGGTAATVNLGSTPLSLADTVTALNNDSGFTTAGLTASYSGNKLIITGATDATGTATIDTSASSLTTTPASVTYGGLAGGTSTSAAASVASTSSTQATNTFTLGASTDKLSGTFSYAVGGGTAATVNLGSTPLSLANTVTALNNDSGFMAAGLTASYSGNKLIITGATGDSGSATIDTTGSSLVTTPASTLTMNTGLAAQDAKISVDGGATRTYSSNTISTAITGVTFQILSKSDTPVQVQIVNYNTDIETAFATFVSAYNTVLTDLKTQEGYDSSGNAEPLYGNPVISQIQSALSIALTSGTASGKINNLYQLGISVTSTGALSLDSSALGDTLNNNFADVVGFMQNTGGFGQNLKTTLNNMGSSSSTGAIYLAIAANTAQQSTLTDNISKQETLISAQEASLTSELNTANEILQAIPQQLTEMDMLYSAMTGYNAKSS